MFFLSAEIHDVKTSSDFRECDGCVCVSDLLSLS